MHRIALITSKSELQELLSEGKAKKRKFGPAKHVCDNSASKLSRGLNDKILKQSRSGDLWEKKPAASTLRQCDRDSQVVLSVEFDEYVSDTNGIVGRNSQQQSTRSRPPGFVTEQSTQAIFFASVMERGRHRGCGGGQVGRAHSVQSSWFGEAVLQRFTA